MLLYDLTESGLFHADTRDAWPTDAEMFAITVALLLVHEATYTDLWHEELRLSAEDLTAVAECIEYRLHPLGRDFGDPERLRTRLRDFVGLRIGMQLPTAATSGPT